MLCLQLKADKTSSRRGTTMNCRNLSRALFLAQRQKLIAIKNMPDHLHLLIGLRPDLSLSDLVRDVKAGSSKFIKEKRWVAGRFSWQQGFGAFSYSRSQLGTVIRYIENQQQHHAKKSFREEYIDLLEKFGVDHDRTIHF